MSRHRTCLPGPSADLFTDPSGTRAVQLCNGHPEVAEVLTWAAEKVKCFILGFDFSSYIPSTKPLQVSMHPEQTSACSKQSTVTFSRRKRGVGGCGVRFPVRKDSFPLLAIVPVISPPGMLPPDLLSDSHEESAQILLFPETLADPLQRAVIAPLVNTWTTRCRCYFTFCIFPLISLSFFFIFLSCASWGWR